MRRVREGIPTQWTFDLSFEGSHGRETFQMRSVWQRLQAGLAFDGAHENSHERRALQMPEMQETLQVARHLLRTRRTLFGLTRRVRLCKFGCNLLDISYSARDDTFDHSAIC